MDTYRDIIDQTLGTFWLTVIKDQQTINAIVDGHAYTYAVHDARLAGLLNWLAEPNASNPVFPVDRTVVVSFTHISRTYATSRDSSALYGDGPIGEQYADAIAWTLELPRAFMRIPIIARYPGDQAPLVEGIDYQLVSPTTLHFYENPYELELPRRLLIEEDVPVWGMVLYLPQCLEQGDAYRNRYGFYKIRESGRTAAFTALVQEGSIRALMDAVQAAVGVICPRNYEQADTTGVFTTVVRCWVSGEYAFAETTAGDLIGTPVVFGQSLAPGVVLRPGDSLVPLEINWYNKMADAPVTGYYLSPVFVPNVTSDIVDGEIPVFGDVETFRATLAAALTARETTPAAMFPGPTGNPVTLLYDTFGRKQLPVLYVGNVALGFLSESPELLQLCHDVIPAGTGMITVMEDHVEDTVSTPIAETVTSFILTEHTETTSAGVATTLIGQGLL